MTSQIVSIKTGATYTTETALEILDELRAKIESGEIIAFAAVGIEPDDITFSWTASTRPVSRLRMIGAIGSLFHCFQADP